MEVGSFIEKLYRLSQVPISVYDKQGNLQCKVPSIKCEYSEFEREKTEYILNETEKQKFLFAPYSEKFPAGICGCAGTEFDFVLGPFAYGKLEGWDARHFMKENKITNPVECRLADVLTAADFILEMYSDTPLDYEALFKVVISQSGGAMNEVLLNEELQQYDSFQKNHDYREEEFALELVSAGDLQWFEKHKGNLIPTYPIILDDIKKNEEYIAVVVISLVARAAISGGLTSQEGFLINDIYLKKISKCKSVEQIHSVMEEAIYYCVSSVAKRNAMNAANIHVEACKKAMISHKCDKIDLDVIAKECGISKGYMQRLFREHEGMSVTDYFIKIKIEAACNLLKYSDRSVGEIAAYLGFGSLSYFSDYFKRKVGKTPAQYRSENQGKEFKVK